MYKIDKPEMDPRNFYEFFLELQKAIRQFHWIGPAMLGARIDRSLSTVRDLIDQAVNYILQTNSELLPRYIFHGLPKISHTKFFSV